MIRNMACGLLDHINAYFSLVILVILGQCLANNSTLNRVSLHHAVLCFIVIRSTNASVRFGSAPFC